MNQVPFRRLGWVALVAVALLAAVDRIFPPPLESASRVATMVLDRDGRLMRAFPSPDGRWRFRTDLSAVDPEFIRRLIAVEDARFWNHPGVDPAALGRAAFTSLRAGRVVSGGSTITMQTARLLEPRPRTVASKLVEMFRAGQIERRLSKREILELYLTLAPYGGNLEGVRAASLAYFEHEPSGLSDAETALLIALPQAPETRRPDRRPAAAVRARSKVLERLVSEGLVSPSRAAEAAAQPPPSRADWPAFGYHVSRRLATGRQAEIHTTIDLSLQIDMEDLCRESVGADREAQSALMIVDNASGAVRVAVGSAGFDRPGGWMDLCRARRSPGSTLKPFVYGLAFDDGVAAPGTIIVDRRRRFGNYAPRNFDREFRGEVRVHEALRHSLNVPAVAALQRVGARRFRAALLASGATPTLPPGAGGESGLALALGGAGITLEELACLYAGLARGGVVRPLVWTTGTETAPDLAPGYPLLTAAAATRIGDILRTVPAPAGRTPAALSRAAPRIAIKTGTSWGYRDAWAAGFTEDWTVVVWQGRADGRPRTGVTGRTAALPLLFEIFDRLPMSRVSVSGDGINRPPLGALSLLERPRSRPDIEFPPDDSEVVVSSFGGAGEGLALVATGGAGDLRWYVEGAPLPRGTTRGAAHWRPSGPGFYRLEVVDAAGASRSATIRVRRAESSIWH